MGPHRPNEGGHRLMDLADFTRDKPAIIMQQMQAHLRYVRPTQIRSLQLALRDGRFASEREKQELQAWLAYE